MSAILRKAAVNLRRQLRLRLRHGRLSFPVGWRKRLAAAALFTAVATALVTFAIPFSQNSGFYSPPYDTIVDITVDKKSANDFPEPNNNSANDLPEPPPQPTSDIALVLVNSSALNSRPMLVESSPRTPASVEIDLGGRDRKVIPSKREIEYWRLAPDEALRQAKKAIFDAPMVTEDRDLHAPLFHNVSVFKRSYELMEKILKVYIYEEGERPIFHTPELQGIYASEGWFMKLIEEKNQFVVKDPNKAHLFYLPYSSQKLRLTLYVPNSHNIKPLSLFLRDHVNMLAAKYPFWNRTRGADHFIVACHDWGPYTTVAHEELCKNTIKALCNADASEGIFVRGKDVSLPETTIRVPKRPLRYVGGGKRVSQRPILAFYAGNMHGRVRPELVKHWGDKEDDMRIYRRLPNRVSRNMSYVEHMKSSKFCLCPMGYEVNSPRIVEAIYSECVPVIIADNFVLPFEEVLDWSSFSLVVAEKDVPNLRNILLGISLRRYIRMLTCVKMVQKHFLWHAKPMKYDLFHMILHSIWFNRLNQIQ